MLRYWVKSITTDIAFLLSQAGTIALVQLLAVSVVMMRNPFRRRRGATRNDRVVVAAERNIAGTVEQAVCTNEADCVAAVFPRQNEKGLPGFRRGAVEIHGLLVIGRLLYQAGTIALLTPLT